MVYELKLQWKTQNNVALSDIQAIVCRPLGYWGGGGRKGRKIVCVCVSVGVKW
jgi:hypothetical protein